MCWITLTPSPKRKHHHHDPHSDHSSSASDEAEHLVRVHKRTNGPRYTKVRIVAPIEKHHHHQHPHLRHHHPNLHPHLPHLPHLHPLHMHPLHLPHHHHHHWKIHGHGKKRAPPPPPPPPSSCPSPKEPIYRTQIVEPARREVRETTRVALREGRTERGRLRRVAGYEVLGREVPWDWECISSVASGGGDGKKGGGGDTRRGGSGLKYPPFGGMDRWM